MVLWSGKSPPKEALMAQKPRPSRDAAIWLRRFVKARPCAAQRASSGLAFPRYSTGFSALATKASMLWTGPTNHEGPVRRPIGLPATWRTEC
jgi:hypothetical protein